MKLLALDTATEACSAALYIDGDIEQIYQLAPREHTQLILGMAEQLLMQAGINIKQLDALAFGRGPGSFTGVRIATGVVQGMAYAADLPVVPVSTLASIAQSVYQAHGAEQILSVMDARMGGVYRGAYRVQQGVAKLQGEEAVSSPEQLPLLEGRWVGAGSGWRAYRDILQQRLGACVEQQFDDVFPESRSIAQLAVADFKLGLAVDAAHAVPVYLRNDVAKKSAAQGPAQGRPPHGYTPAHDVR